MGVANDPHWLDEAVRQLEGLKHQRMGRRLYDVSTVGARVRTAREIVGMTQPQLAKRIGVSPWLISNIERGQRDLPMARVPGLCRSLGVSQAWLLMQSDDGGPPVPSGILRKQIRVNWRRADQYQKARAKARAELERMRGLRPPLPHKLTTP